MILSQMQLLQMVSNHIGLILPQPDDSPERHAKHMRICRDAFKGNEQWLSDTNQARLEPLTR